MITTIIANYNYGEYVVESIQSALNQTVKNKVVVIDDGSRDSSINKILTAFNFDSNYDSLLFGKNTGNFPVNIYSSEKIDLICSKNLGASTARNLGMWHSWDTTEYFGILDADDSILPQKYEKFIEFMGEEAVGVVYGDYIIRRPGYPKYEYKQPYSVQALSEQCIVHSGSLIKKSYLEKVLLSDGQIYDKNLHGPGSETFRGSCEDYDLFLRLSKVCMMIHVPEALSIVNEHDKNASKKVTQQIFNKNMEIIRNRT